MASIQQRGNRFCVVYSYDTPDGQHKQKWETFRTQADAKRRKAEIEYKQELGSFVVPQCKTMDELLTEYVNLYGKVTWSVSMYRNSTALIQHYISPFLGSMKLTDITSRVLEKYYMTLLKTKAVPQATDRKYSRTVRYVTPATVQKIHNLLRNCFHQAVKWELIEKNPALYATVPKAEEKKREIWDAPTLFRAMEVCQDERLRMAMNLSFACSLRLGEILGLTWDCVEISPERIADGTAYIYVTKSLQRTPKETLELLDEKDILLRFPENGTSPKSVLVLKKPKTATSVRKVFLPQTVAQMLVQWKLEQEDVKEALGCEYQDYNLVIAGPMGMPTEQTAIEHAFRRLIRDNDLPEVVFHSLRHTSITYKLKLNGGDIKAVQGDSGHAQAKMVTDQYSHILDEDRKENARLIEEAFYAGGGKEPEEGTGRRDHSSAANSPDAPVSGSADLDVLMKLIANPEMASLLKALADKL